MATKVTFKRDKDQNIDTIPFVNGQLTYNSDNGETYMDIENGQSKDRVPISRGANLGIRGAQVQQVAQIIAVDEKGRPTKWTSIDLKTDVGSVDLGLGITGAAPGQMIEIAEVNQKTGAPVRWRIVEKKDDQQNDLGIKGAKINQFIQIAEVDENGVPQSYKTSTIPEARFYRF